MEMNQQSWGTDPVSARVNRANIKTKSMTITLKLSVPTYIDVHELAQKMAQLIESHEWEDMRYYENSAYVFHMVNTEAGPKLALKEPNYDDDAA